MSPFINSDRRGIGKKGVLRKGAVQRPILYLIILCLLFVYTLLIEINIISTVILIVGISFFLAIFVMNFDGSINPNKRASMSKKAVSRFLIYSIILSSFLIYNLFSYRTVRAYYYMYGFQGDAGRYCICYHFGNSDSSCAFNTVGNTYPGSVQYFTNAGGCRDTLCGLAGGRCSDDDTCSGDNYYNNEICRTSSPAGCTVPYDEIWSLCENPCDFGSKYCDSGSTGNCAANEICWEYGASSAYCEDPDTSQDACIDFSSCFNAWMPAGSNSYADCCGDDGASDDFETGNSAQGCCCSGVQIATGNDATCANVGGTAYWCVDGTWCDSTGYARDASTTAGGTNYLVVGDDIYCGCNGVGDKCDTDEDGIAEGICTADPSCDTGLVALSGVVYYADCAAARECDNDVTPTAETPRYVRTGYCASTSCCTSIISSGEYSQTSETWSSGNEECDCDEHEICDDSPETGPSADGVCADSSCVTGTASCDVSNDDCNPTSGNLYASCGPGRYCDNNVGGAGYDRDGYCTTLGVVCCTTEVDSGENSQDPTLDWDGNDEDCICDSHRICWTTPETGTPAGDGVCVSTTCDTDLVSCDVSDDDCDPGTGTLASTCAAGSYCDSDVASVGYDRDGFCHGSSSTTCCTSDVNSGEYSQQTEDWGGGDETCTCVEHYICDSNPTTGAIGADGVCVSTTCDTGLVACDVSNDDCNPLTGDLFASCAAGRYCDNNVGDAGYDRDGYCAGSSCATSTIAASTQDPATDTECGALCSGGGSITDGDEDYECDTTNEGQLCSSQAGTGTPPAIDGYCVEDTCRTSGDWAVNCGATCGYVDLTDANMVTCDTSFGHGWACDSVAASTGWEQDGTCLTFGTCDTSGEICYDGADYIDDCSTCGYATTDNDHCDSDATSGGDYS